MKVPRKVLGSQDCELKRLLEERGPAAVKAVLASPYQGKRFRQHAERCSSCRRIVKEHGGGIAPPADL